MTEFRKNRFFKAGVLGLITTIISGAVYFAGDVSYLLKTSLVGYPEHAPFNGTVYPVKKVPDWVHLSSDKVGLAYSSLSSSDLVDIPYYEPADLAVSTDTLGWKSAADLKIRNEKITYSVPYMGNYLLDGQEGMGSHLAVDIKIPSGTPVFSIANGTVIKTSNQSDGFGRHIVIVHNNVPTLENKDAKVVLYSSYSHLSDVLVNEGDVVTKGEQIALSGNSGLATTPHLHFQLDNDEAPWHPFWPFTWAEASEAGYDFFSAVNAGLGQDVAYVTTVNPMKYVQKYLSYQGGSVSGNNSGSTGADSYIPNGEGDDDNEGVEENIGVDDVADVADAAVQNEVVLEPPKLTLEFDVLDKYYVGQSSDFKVLLRDQYGNNFREGLDGEIVVRSSGGLITAKPSIADRLKFDIDGVLKGSFRNMREGRDKLKVTYNGGTYYSDWFEIVDDGSNVTFSDVDDDNSYRNAVSYLVKAGVVDGYPDGTFKPDKTVSRVEALKFIYEGIHEKVSEGDLPFSDVSKSEWYGKYLHTAYKKGVVNGYGDGSFRPTNTVNKAEFYKILFNGMGVEVDKNVTVAPFKDVSVDDWYAPYVAHAKELGVIDSSVKYLRASDGMSRGEVADAIYRLMLAL